MNTAKQFTSIATALGLMALSAPGAAEIQVFPGTFCEDINNEISESNVYYGATHFIENRATGANTVGCPVVRDTYNSVSDWDVTVNRNGTSGTWELTLFSTDLDGDSFFSDIISVPASPTSGVLTIDGDPVSSFADGGMLYITSIMLADSRIHRYLIDEAD